MAQQGYYGQQQQQQQPYYGQQQYQPGYGPPQGAPPPQGPYTMNAPNYPQPQAPPQQQQQQQAPVNYGAKPSEAEMFTPSKPKWNDLIFAILFWAHFAAFIALSVIALRTVGNAGGTLAGDGANGPTLNLNTAYLLALICAAGFVCALIFLWITKTFTKIILEISLFLSVAFSVGYAVYLWIQKFYSGAIIFTIFAVISVICYFPMRRRIPFSKLLLQLVFRIAKQYKSVYVAAILTSLVQGLYSVWWSFTVVGLYQKYSPNSAGGCQTGGGACGNGSLIPAVIFSVFSFYWTTQVISNVSLTTIAGIFGTWYFSMTDQKTKHAALSSFKRAMTYSFGSIAEGSLIVALLDVIRAGLNIVQQQEAMSGDAIGAFIACCASCLVGCVRGLVDYFNRYAYIQIAMFGKSYIKAAKDAWNLLKQRGIDALINDSLVNIIWTFGSYAVGVLTSLFAYLYLHLVRPSYIEDNSNFYAIILLYAFLIGFQLTHSLGYVALSSGVSTIFVALAEAPQALAEKDPALFNHIVQAYPQVVQPV